MNKLKTSFYLLTNITFLLVVTAGLIFGMGLAFMAGELWGSLGQQKTYNTEIRNLESIIEAQNKKIAGEKNPFEYVEEVVYEVTKNGDDTYCMEGMDGCMNCRENPDNWICANMRTLEAPESEPEKDCFKTNATVTAYCLQGIMANGEQVHSGAIACPIWDEFDLEINIDDKTYVCEDRMAEWFRETPRYDIWFESCDDAMRWGIKNLEIEKCVVQ